MLNKTDFAQAVAHAALLAVDELKLLAVVVNAMVGDAMAMRVMVDAEVASVGGPAWRRKVKAEAKTQKVHKPLATRKNGKYRKPNPDMARTDTAHTGLRGDILEVLKQSSGKLTCEDIAEFTKTKTTTGKVSANLADLFQRGDVPKGMKREEAINPNTNRRRYVYWLDGNQ